MEALPQNFPSDIVNKCILPKLAKDWKARALSRETRRILGWDPEPSRSVGLKAATPMQNLQHLCVRRNRNFSYASKILVPLSKSVLTRRHGQPAPVEWFLDSLKKYPPTSLECLTINVSGEYDRTDVDVGEALERTISLLFERTKKVVVLVRGGVANCTGCCHCNKGGLKLVYRIVSAHPNVSLESTMSYRVVWHIAANHRLSGLVSLQHVTVDTDLFHPIESDPTYKYCETFRELPSVQTFRVVAAGAITTFLRQPDNTWHREDVMIQCTNWKPHTTRSGRVWFERLGTVLSPAK